MVLYSLLKGYEVHTQLGENVGKVKGLIVDTTNWNVGSVIVSHGLLKKNVIYSLDTIKETNEIEKKIIMPADAEEGELPKKSSINLALLDDVFIGKMAISDDKEEVGKIYDCDVSIKLKKWPIWKILIKRGMKDRRVRLDTKDIVSVGENVKLNKPLKDILGEDEEEKD